MYGDRIYIPTEEDLQKAFLEYSTDAGRRMQHDQDFPSQPRQLRPGETVKELPDGRVQASGQVAVSAEEQTSYLRDLRLQVSREADRSR